MTALATQMRHFGMMSAMAQETDKSQSDLVPSEPVTVVEFDPAPEPGWDSRPHLRSITVSAAEGAVAPGTCIRTVAI